MMVSTVRPVPKLGTARCYLRAVAAGTGGAGSPTRRGEVLVVGGRGPRPAPRPPDRGEAPNGDAPRTDHARQSQRPVGESPTGGRQDGAPGHIGVLDRVDVDGPAVRVLRPRG